MSKALRIIFWSVSGLVVLIVLALCCITWYLTPARLSEIISREMSEYFNAEVKVENARFTFWSSFPRFTLETDSVIIISHTLDGLPQKTLEQLPGDPKLLATATSLSGGINVIQLLRGKYVMRDLEVSSLHLNIVAVNDSVNNYDILPPQPEKKEKIPFFTSNILTLKNPEGIDFYFAESDTRGHIDLDNVVMKRVKGDNDYNLSLDGRITASTGHLTIFKHFPFGLHGDINLGFKPFELKFQNFAINLESVKSRLNMTLDLQGDMKISSLDYKVSMINLMKLMKVFPWLPMGDLKNFDTDFEVELSARLDRPYTFKSGELPWVTVTARIPGGRFDYETTDNRNFPVDYSDIIAGLNFNGDSPRSSTLFLHELTLTSRESSVTLSAEATNLLESPVINMEFSGHSDLTAMAKRIPQMEKWDIGGDLSFTGSANGFIEELSAAGLEKGIQHLEFETAINTEDLHFNIDGYKFKSGNVSLTAKSQGYSTNPENPLNVPIEVAVTGEDVSLGTPSGDLTYQSNHISTRTVLKELDPEFNFHLLPINFSAESFTLDFGKGNNFTLNNATASFGKVEAKRYLPGAEEAPATHYLAFKAPTGELHASFSKMANPLDNIDVYYSPDSIHINSLGIRCLSTHANISGTAVNVREFLQSDMKAPLKVDMDIACDTIDINQLAHTYYKGSKTASPKPAVASKEDTDPILIPKNIDATFRLSAKESIYTNLHLFNLGGTVRVKNGVASVDNFVVGADFGHATLGLKYDTSDIQNMSLSLNVSLLDINVVKFFKNFHTLLLMMPEMSNLEGMVSLNLTGSLNLFPDMYINMPSLNADISLKGWDLVVHQNHFIHRLARKLLIRGDGDLHIKNMDVTAIVRDNLLELYPFNFQVDNYRLRAEGTNNFNGNLYYHIDVEKSPIPFKFGVNVEGLFHDPKIRFGRARYDQKKGEEITLMNEVETRMNLVKEVKYYVKEFIRKAAESKEN